MKTLQQFINENSITKLEQLLGTKLVNLGEYNDKPIKDLISEFSDITSKMVKIFSYNYINMLLLWV